jgi:hypothetical protein
VPAYQVETLFHEINTTIESSQLAFDSKSEELGLAIMFPNHPDLTPRFLGQSRSRRGFIALEQNLPPNTYRPEGEPAVSPADARSLESWKNMMDRAFEAMKAKKKQDKVQAETRRRGTKQAWRGELKSAQCYLGLRPKVNPPRRFMEFMFWNLTDRCCSPNGTPWHAVERDQAHT